jgi:hypothetical protein
VRGTTGPVLSRRACRKRRHGRLSPAGRSVTATVVALIAATLASLPGIPSPIALPAAVPDHCGTQAGTVSGKVAYAALNPVFALAIHTPSARLMRTAAINRVRKCCFRAHEHSSHVPRAFLGPWKP